MADELEALWSKLTFTEEEGEGIELGSESTRAAREIGKNCLVMKILTQRIIVLDALRKHLKMLWKPNRGIWISEIDEDLYLVEFGDGRDKKRILEMCPWSYEKQLVLLQEFEGERVPKDITIKWTPFWVQIYNLPLMSMTRESGMEIGGKIGRVLDVDVPEKGVQWGKYLRVRVRLDATKKLVRGKRVTIEGGESRWVFFKYERLPNFCYQCGKLDHGVKECKESAGTENRAGGEEMQYGAWLRGEPGRRGGRDQGNMGEENGREGRPYNGAPIGKKHGGDTVRIQGEEEMGDTHVTGQNHHQGDAPSVNSGKLQVTGQSEDSLHDGGKVNLTTEKVKCNLTPKGMVGVRPSLSEADLVGEMSWETSKKEDGDKKTEESARQETRKEVGKEMGLKSGAEEDWANNNSSPLAMIYNQEKGWVTETLGLTSGHWKRLARKVTTPSPNKLSGPSKTKRKGQIPLQELDPNVTSAKRRKGKVQEIEITNEHESTDGGEAVAAAQHRRAS